MSEQSAPSTEDRWPSLEAGFFLVLVAAPLVFAPFATLPFASPKFFLLMLGTALIAAARPSVDRRLGIAAGAWCLGLLLSSLVGQDPWWSIVGPEPQFTGVLTLGASAFLLCAATGLDADLRRRLPSWLFWAGVAVSGVAVFTRFVQPGGPTWRLNPLSATIGHRIFVGAFTAAAVLAAVAIIRTWRHHLGLLVIGSGLAVSAVRSAWLGLAIGAVAIVVTSRALTRTVIATLVPVILVIAAWTVADPYLPQGDIEYSAAQRFGELEEGSAAQRLPALRAYTRGWANDPIFGAGPGTGWNLYLRNVEPIDLRSLPQPFGDAHNIIVEIGATAGLVGLLPLVGLGILSATRLRGAPSERRWALGVAVALATFHLFQPLNIVITPLLFLATGLALRSPTGVQRAKVPRALVLLLLVGLLLASLRFAAGTMDKYGQNYASEEAYRWSLRLEPRNLGTRIRFAKFLALDWRSGDAAAGREARTCVAIAIRQHSWHPAVRLGGADVMILLNDLDAADDLVRQHLRIFPNDPAALTGASALANRRGDHRGAAVLARRALDIDPDNKAAREALRIATKKRDQ